MGQRWVLTAATVLAVAAGSGCAATESAREREADRVAQVVADAISYPRQSDADGFVRAAHDVRAGRDGRLTVVAMERSGDDELGDRLARLTFRVHLPAVDDGWGQDPALTRCYRVDFARYGVMDGSPTSTDCPARRSWVDVAPAPPKARTPAGTSEVVRRALRAAPRTVDAEVIRGSIVGTMPALPPGSLSPDVEVGIDGADIGVSVHDDTDCLMGARVDGRVLVWALSWAQAEPGEIPCTPASALGRLGTHPPH
jgi:hypothetical protein